MGRYKHGGGSSRTIILVLPLLLLLLGVMVDRVEGKKVLLLPVSVISHARQMMMVGEALADSGHDVYAVYSPAFHGLPLFKDSKVKIILHSTTYDDLTTVPVERVIEIIKDMSIKRDFISSVRENLSEWGNMCLNQLVDDELHAKLKAMEFDLAIVDVFPFSRCLLPIPYNLGIPYVGLETQYEPWLIRTPALPSFVPSNNLVGAYTPVMNFWERLHNLWVHIDWFAFPGVTYLEDDYINKFIRDKPYITMNALFAGCELFLTDVDAVLDYARPQLPHEIPIGGISTKPAKPLPEDLEEFMISAPNGVILISFGSYSYDFTAEQYAEFFSAFRQLSYKFLWKHHEIPEGLPDNVKILPWLPQNDILGHPQTKMFLTHVGNNGQFEGLYHAVPMIGYPMFGDQLYNCRRMVFHGFGLCVDTENFKGEYLVKAVHEISTNSSYKKNIELASEIFKDRPMKPAERAVYWIEHVMNFGGKHLRCHGLDLPWYQYWMLDILAVVMTIVIISSHVAVAIIFRIVRYFRGATHQHKKTD